jgi:Tfp pilus assembly protein PilO
MSASSQDTTGRTNDMLWATIGILGVLGMSYFYVAPRMATLKEARAITQAKEQDSVALQAQITQVDKTAKELNAQPEVLKQLALAVPSSTAYDQLLVALQAITSESGVILSSIHPTSGVATGAAQQATATLAIKGSYSGVHLFLETIAKNIRPLKVTNLALTSAVDATGVSLLNATLIVTAAQAITPITATTTTATGGTQ